MATKHKHRTKRDAAGLLQQAERLLEKGNYKDALKDAKVCYRQDNTPESRRLLERAHLARAKQLHAAGLRPEACAVAESLLDLRVTDVAVQQELPKLLIALGLSDRCRDLGGPTVVLEDGSPLWTVMADHAVLRPATVPAAQSAIRQGAEIVRQALAALETGDEAQALAALRDIPRASPFADWKYLVRGLAAYYRRDTAETQANWDRLEAGRFAAKIASRLKSLSDRSSLPAADRYSSGGVTRLADQLLGGPVVDRLQQLQEHLSAGRWRDAVRLLRVAQATFRQVNPVLPQRLTAILAATLARKGLVDAVEELATAAEPLPLDPHWNRARALAWEYSEDGDMEKVAEVTRYWRAYAEELAGMECLPPAERPLAQALVWLRLGRFVLDETAPLCTTCGVRHDVPERDQAMVVECLEKSLQLAPDLLPAYQALSAAYKECERPDEAAAIWRRIVERFPEDVDALLLLTTHLLNRDDPLAARDFIARAEKLRPLDLDIKTLAWTVHTGSARHYALAGRWDEGRAELAAAEALGSPQPSYRLLVRRAAFEFKAGQNGLGHHFLELAQKDVGEATPVWLLMTIQAFRYALPRVVAEDFERRWLAALKKRRSALAIKEMCLILLGHVAEDIRYAGRARHVGCLLDSLARSSRVKWQPQDLYAVFDFLLAVEHQERMARNTAADRSRRSACSKVEPVLEQYVAKALKGFPQVAFFQFLAAELEMRQGPWKCDRPLLREHLERAVELAQGSNDQHSQLASRRATQMLDTLQDFENRPFGTMPPPWYFAKDDADDADDDAGCEDADDESLNPPFTEQDLQDFRAATASPTSSPQKLFAIFARMCQSMGLDPETIIDRTASRGPFRFREEDLPQRGKKRP